MPALDGCPKDAVISLLLHENEDNEIKRSQFVFQTPPRLPRGSRKVTCPGSEGQKLLGLISGDLPFGEKMV